jgi:hypothetical protein
VYFLVFFCFFRPFMFLPCLGFEFLVVCTSSTSIHLYSQLFLILFIYIILYFPLKKIILALGHEEATVDWINVFNG